MQTMPNFVECMLLVNYHLTTFIKRLFLVKEADFIDRIDEIFVADVL